MKRFIILLAALLQVSLCGPLATFAAPAPAQYAGWQNSG